jgi:hypothetical protein
MPGAGSQIWARSAWERRHRTAGAGSQTGARRGSTGAGCPAGGQGWAPGMGAPAPGGRLGWPGWLTWQDDRRGGEPARSGPRDADTDVGDPRLDGRRGCADRCGPTGGNEPAELTDMHVRRRVAPPPHESAPAQPDAARSPSWTPWRGMSRVVADPFCPGAFASTRSNSSNRSDKLIPRASASLKTRSSDGEYAAFSTRLMDCRSQPAFSASFSCERPSDLRFARTTAPKDRRRLWTEGFGDGGTR